MNFPWVKFLLVLERHFTGMVKYGMEVIGLSI